MIWNKTSGLILALVVVAIAGTLSVRAYLGHADTAGRLDTARDLIGPDWPLLPADHATTDGQIYLDNLNAQIGALERRMATSRGDHVIAKLAMLLYHRFQVEGRLEDAEKSRAMLASRTLGPHDSSVDLAHARILLAFHAFDGVARAIEAAEENGAPADAVSGLRQTLARARGLSMPQENEPSRASQPTPADLVMRAGKLREQGRLAEASRLLKAAQDAYVDSAPFVLAWIHVQQGIVFLEHSDYATARLFFMAAYRRFPQYTVAVEHLAETELAMGNFDRAAALYRAAGERSDHPEFYHQLAAAERGRGNHEAAAEFAEQAEDGYRELVDQYPLTYADHATLYYMDVGKRDKAVELASLNFAERPNADAKELLAKARECCR